MTDFILTRSDQGDGGWSLHARDYAHSALRQTARDAT